MVADEREGLWSKSHLLLPGHKSFHDRAGRPYLAEDGTLPPSDELFGLGKAKRITGYWNSMIAMQQLGLLG